ncbi:MAG TPA: KUP/HAK/KT family potassium transporter, partial [Cyclobacteriaceae bacterium]|nr:KUP/HAK/KT family potassium transporter [Cyclobacteriaceae bacterium]
MDSLKDSRLHKLSAAGVLVAMGIIYGDIGTSPIYTLRFIVGEHVITEDLILGGLSCVFWTLTLITSIKYIYLALNADNKGEGGIFALYALVRRYKAQWVIFPAIIGCC